MSAAVLAALLSAAAPGLAGRAEARAAAAAQACAGGRVGALDEAVAALALTAEFEPTAFVRAGRKGELVEDEFLAARDAYRRHRAGLYAALGECLLASGRPAEATRVLRRAELLGDAPEQRVLLARALLAASRPQQVLALVRAHALEGLPAGLLALAERAADTVGLPSLQVEIDRARLQALPTAQRPELRDGPLPGPERARLSSGAPFRWADAEMTLAYVGDVGCASCSADLEAVARVAPRGARVVVAAEDPNRDEALRRVLALYRRDWPVVNGPRLGEALGTRAPVLVVAARGGFVAALVRGRLEQAAPPVLAALSREDLGETRPRAAWNRRPVERVAEAPPPAWLPEGLAPAEVDPAPPAFEAARQAFAAGRFAEALAGFERLAGPADAVLLPPEARLDRALCLIGLGRRDEARRLLLRIGDSRFQEEVDRALEQAAR